LVCELPYKDCLADILVQDSCLWAVPSKGMDLICYDTKSKDKTEYIVGSEMRENLMPILFDEKIFIFPKYVKDALYIFDLKNHSFYKDKKWENFEFGIYSEKKLITGCLLKNNVCITIKDTNKILFYNMENMEIDIKEVGAGNRFFCISALNDQLTVTYDDSLSFGIINGSKLCIEKVVGGIPDKKIYVRTISIKDALILSDGLSVYLWKENMKDPQFLTQVDSMNENGSPFMTYIEREHQYYLLPWNSKKVIILDKNFRVCGTFFLLVPFKSIVKNSPVIYEDDYTIDEFLKLIPRKEAGESKEYLEQSGEQIFSKLYEDYSWKD